LTLDIRLLRSFGRSGNPFTKGFLAAGGINGKGFGQGQKIDFLRKKSYDTTFQCEVKTVRIDPGEYRQILFFTGAGMSAESGVPTYRGRGGVWHQYNWEEYACQRAFDRNPEKVLEFHRLRRKAVWECQPHTGHHIIAALEKSHPHVTVVTQNIDGMHQRAGSHKVVELHGSLWRLRCPQHGVREDYGETYENLRCEVCQRWLRPDIVWFEDSLDQAILQRAIDSLGSCDLFISIGTSGVVYPAAGFPPIAKNNGAFCIEINPESSPLSSIYDENIRDTASKALEALFPG
jgi:NAD-dependent deacetylase